MCVARSKISSSDGRKQGRYDQTGKTFTDMVKSIFHEARFRTMSFTVFNRKVKCLNDTLFLLKLQNDILLKHNAQRFKTLNCTKQQHILMYYLAPSLFTEKSFIHLLSTIFRTCGLTAVITAKR